MARPPVGTARPRSDRTISRPSVERPAREAPARAGAAAASPVPGDSTLASEAAGRLSGQAIAFAGVIVVFGVVLSRVLGFVRTAVLNAQFGGGSDELAAFNAAFRIPDTLFQLVAAGAVGSALVPVAAELLARGEDERARRLVGTMANLMVALLVPLALVIWVLAPLLVASIVAPGFGATQQGLTTELTRWLLLSPILLAIGAVLTAGLNALGIFAPPAIAPNVYNVAIIAAAVLLTPFFGVYALVLGVVAGAAGHVATQLPAVARLRLYRPVLDVHDPAVRETLTLIAPRALGMGVTQVVFFVFVAFTTTLNDGGRSLNVWTTAFTTLQIPVGLIGVPLGIVLLPPLSQAIATGATERFARLVDWSLRLLLFVVLPLTGFMFVLAAPGNALLWGHGRYTPDDVAYTTSVFVVLLAGLVAHVLIALLAPIFYAGKDTRTPVAAALVAVVVDVVGAVALFSGLGLTGLAIAISLGAWAEVAILLYLIERRIGFSLGPLRAAVAAIVPGTVLASGAAWVVDRAVSNLFGGSTAIPALTVELALAGAAGAGVFAAWSRFLRLPELDAAVEMGQTIAARFRRAG